MLDYLQIYPETKSLVKRYPPAERCALYEAMMDYAFTGQEPAWNDDDIKWFGWDALKQAVDRSESARNRAQKAGKASAEQRKATRSNTAQQTATEVNTAQQNATECNPEAEAEAEADTEAEKRDNAQARRQHSQEQNARFERFWSEYPRHTSKDPARKAFAKIDPDDSLLGIMLTAIAKQKASPQWSDPQYIPHPSTWLNQHRWEDEVVQGQPKQAQQMARPVMAQQYTQRSYAGEEEINDLIDWLAEDRKEAMA